jgi:hypothetical protein
LGSTRDRTHHEELVEGQLGVVPMTAGDSELALNICRGE